MLYGLNIQDADSLKLRSYYLFSLAVNSIQLGCLILPPTPQIITIGIVARIALVGYSNCIRYTMNKNKTIPTIQLIFSTIVVGLLGLQLKNQAVLL
jgi:hypothetical protein